MFHFLAKIGKKPWAKTATAILISSVPMGYLGVHSYGHTIVRNLLIAEDGLGGKAEISERLQALIMSVSQDIQNMFDKSVLPESFNRFNQGSFARKQTPIKWFASCLLMPSTFGSTGTKTGVIIGLPNHLNYDKVEDLPDSMFQLREIKLFKTDTDKKPEDTEEQHQSADEGIVKRLNKDSPEVQQYANSLILSDKAKKFIIARELFMADSYRVFSMFAVITISGLIALTISRSAVKALKLADAHVTQRLSVYSLGGLLGYCNFIAVADASNQGYIVEADKKAASLNKEYYEGAMEYFEKTIERNKAMRELLDDFKEIYDEKGNVRQPMIRFKYVPLDERLKKIRVEVIES